MTNYNLCACVAIIYIQVGGLPYQAEHKSQAKSEGKLPKRTAITGVPMGSRSISSLRASQM